MEIRATAHATGFDKRAEQLLAGSFEDAGLRYNKIARYSLTSTSSFKAEEVRKLVEELKGKHKLILAVGAEAMKALCGTKKTLDQYAGSLTWNKTIDSWVLPSHHPSVVYVGDKKTLNSRYDKFDFLFDHIHRAF